MVDGISRNLEGDDIAREAMESRWIKYLLG